VSDVPFPAVTTVFDAAKGNMRLVRDGRVVDMGQAGPKGHGKVKRFLQALAIMAAAKPNSGSFCAQQSLDNLRFQR
jgi:hypothetical protein